MLMLEDIDDSYDAAWEAVLELKEYMGDLDYAIPLEWQVEDIETIEQNAERILAFVAELRARSGIPEAQR